MPVSEKPIDSTPEAVYSYYVDSVELARQLLEHLLWLEEIDLAAQANYVLGQLTATVQNQLSEQLGQLTSSAAGA